MLQRWQGASQPHLVVVPEAHVAAWPVLSTWREIVVDFVEERL